MNTKRVNSTSRRITLASLLLACAVAIAVMLPTQIFAAPKYGNSLDWVPADAVFYSASLRMREQVEIVSHSNAWAKLTSLPAVQMAWQFAQFGLNRPGGPGEKLHQFLTDPQNKELLELVADGFSNEILLYGDPHAADFVDIAFRTVNAMQYSSMIADLNSHGNKQQTISRILLNSLDLHRDRLTAPGLVLGFRITNPARAQSQLKRLEALVQPALDSEPRFQGSLKHASVGGSDYLTWELDGTMVPWQQIPWDQLSEKPGQYDQLRAKIAGLKLVVCAGVHANYLLVSIGRSTDHLAALGTGKLLADVPELKPVLKYAEQRLTSISYVSKAMFQAVSNNRRNLDELVQMVRRVLPEAGLPEELNQRINKDAEELAGDLKTVVPAIGAQVSFSFLTPRGIEGYAHDWAQNLYSDASKPLDLLEHVGGNPLLAVVGRSKYSPQQYETLRKWLTKAYGYFEDLAVPHFTVDERQQFVKIKEIALPLVQQVDKATGQMLLPALADGQTGFVLDAKVTSKHWFEGLPESEQPLPMLEAAIVFGVSDVGLLKNACVEYRAVADTIVEKLKEQNPHEIPADFKLPPAEMREVKVGDKTGTIYWYKLPDKIGIDPQITPNAGLTQSVAVLSMEPKHTIRLLDNTPLVVIPDGPLADRRQPLAAACSFQWAGLVDALTPWVDFGVRHFAANATAGLGSALFLADDESRSKLTATAIDDQSANTMLGQVHTVLDVLKTLHTFESATYQSDGATVTHSLTVFHDVP